MSAPVVRIPAVLGIDDSDSPSLIRLAHLPHDNGFAARSPQVLIGNRDRTGALDLYGPLQKYITHSCWHHHYRDTECPQRLVHCTHILPSHQNLIIPIFTT